MSPTVSINLCCYNSEKYLQETIDSVINQTYSDWELIIINDGSTDSTESIVKEYVKRGIPIVYHYQENQGLGYSRNVALKHSKGKYVAFIDHDDVWFLEKLEKQVEILEAFEDFDLVYTNYNVVRGSKQFIKFKFKQPEGNVFENFLKLYPIHISTALVRRSVIDGLESFFDPNLHMTEDYDFCMRILLKSKAKYIKYPLATYRYHAAMSSMTKEVRLIRETISVAEKFKLLIPKYVQRIDKLLLKNRIALAFRLSKNELSKGNLFEARNIIKGYSYSNFKVFIFFLLLFFPSSWVNRLWKSFVEMKSSSLD